jgi:hypothetical protein
MTMLDLDAVNMDPVLRDTPIGDLEVKRHINRIVVAIDGTIIYESGPTGNPWGAIYGKRAHEHTYAMQLMARQEDAKREALEREQAAIREDLIREQERLERKDEDFKALMNYLVEQ